MALRVRANPLIWINAIVIGALLAGAATPFFVPAVALSALALQWLVQRPLVQGFYSTHSTGVQQILAGAYGTFLALVIVFLVAWIA